MTRHILEAAIARLQDEYVKAGATVIKDDVASLVRDDVEKLVTKAFTAPDDGTKEADAERADIVQMLLDRADRALTDSGKRTIKKLIEGETPMPDVCDVVIALGAGQRCTFGAMGSYEWDLWDGNQYRNLLDAQEAYKGFRKMYDTAKPFLRLGKRTADFWSELP